jgi:hypothetical protein
LLNTLGFNISNSKTVPTTHVATCLGIVFHIKIGVIKIPWTKLQEILLLLTTLAKTSSQKNKLQAPIGSLIYLRKATKPAIVFVNRILALLRKMGNTAKVAIDSGTKQDLQWFILCAHVVNSSV